ncbi:AAA family ATPase [Parablastomonas sp. CN1-191]|uniref:AAA family ATPase n=1 Tax=Parablastomonas sp. CN1-191 TaxID=3400908 RepID=UPI003BF87F45
MIHDPVAGHFRSRGEDAALAQVALLLTDERAMFALTAPAGAGKTAFLARLTATVSDREGFAVIDAADSDGTPLTERVARAFRHANPVHFETAMARRAEAGLGALLALDGAEWLDDGERGALEQLVAACPALRILLIGRPVSALGPYQAAVLAPLAASEVAPFLARALGQGGPTFDQRVFTRLHALGEGRPGAVLALARRVVALAHATGRARVDCGMLDAVLLPAAPQVASAEPLARPEPLANPDFAALNERIDRLEERVIEQEQTVRHALTMLIEWIEDGARRAAA